MNIKQGFEMCRLCGNQFHISNPAVHEVKEGFSICRHCFLDVAYTTGWNKKIKPVIVFEYTKVQIPHSTKWEVWKRDRFSCNHCGSGDNLSVDHIHPESFGGTLDIENLQTLCRSCNSKKGTKI